MVHWKGPSMPDVIMLLPEQYVRYALQDYYQELLPIGSVGACVVSGFLVLDDANNVAMRVPDVSEAEQLMAHEAMGSRIWKLSAAPKGRDESIKDILAAPPAWRSTLNYTIDAQQVLKAGQRLDSAAGRHIFYTRTSTSDPLSGLVVKWVFAPGEKDVCDMPTLDLANDDFETVV